MSTALLSTSRICNVGRPKLPLSQSASRETEAPAEPKSAISPNTRPRLPNAHLQRPSANLQRSNAISHSSNDGCATQTFLCIPQTPSPSPKRPVTRPKCRITASKRCLANSNVRSPSPNAVYIVQMLARSFQTLNYADKMTHRAVQKPSPVAQIATRCVQMLVNTVQIAARSRQTLARIREIASDCAQITKHGLQILDYRETTASKTTNSLAGAACSNFFVGRQLTPFPAQ